MANVDCFVIGHGANGTGEGEEFTNSLQEVKLTIKGHAFCRREFGPSFFDHTMFCAGSTGYRADTCKGDSGGGMYCNSSGLVVLAGMTSWGKNGCGNDFGVYTNMDKEQGYIDNVLNPAAFVTEITVVTGTHLGVTSASFLVCATEFYSMYILDTNLIPKFRFY